MRLFQKYHYDQMYKLFHTDFWLFELSIWMHVLARSMISIFIPIFLLMMGYSISHVILYLLIFNIFDFPLNFVAKWITQRIGARLVIMLGSFCYIAFFACLYYLTFGNWTLLIVMALFAALYDTFYWVAHIYFFLNCEKKYRNVTKGVSILYIVKRVAGILAPIIGALILIFTSKEILIIISMVILALSVLPLFKMKHIKDKPTGKATNIKEFFKDGNVTKEYIIQGIYSFHSVAEGIIWPIFIFTLFKTVESVAIIPVIVSITVIIFIFFTGKIKKRDRTKVMALGAFLLAITWILRLVIDNSIFYYFSVFLIGLFSVLVSLPLDSNLFEKGSKKDALATSAYRNFFSMWPRIILYGALYLLLEVFKISFLAAAIGMFVIMAMNFVFILKKPVMGVKEI